MKRLVFSLCLFLWTLSVEAAVTLPKDMNSDDRRIALSILGFGSQSKLLSNPVPLGGYEGFEVGLSTEYIPVEDLSGLGSKENIKGEFSYSVLTFGKGLPYNVDTFVHVTPLPQTDEGIFAYGAHLRWGFHEFPRFPAVMSLVVHGSGVNYANFLNTRTTGADLVMTVAIEDAALYFGGGPIRTVGTFHGGGPDGITAEGTTTDEDLTNIHSVFGLSVSFGAFYVALEIDRVEQSVYGGRLGLRF